MDSGTYETVADKALPVTVAAATKIESALAPKAAAEREKIALAGEEGQKDKKNGKKSKVGCEGEGEAEEGGEAEPESEPSGYLHALTVGDMKDNVVDLSKPEGKKVATVAVVDEKMETEMKNEEVIEAAEKMEYINPAWPSEIRRTQSFTPLFTFELPQFNTKASKFSFNAPAAATDFWNEPDAHLPGLERALVKVEDQIINKDTRMTSPCKDNELTPVQQGTVRVEESIISMSAQVVYIQNKVAQIENTTDDIMEGIIQIAADVKNVCKWAQKFETAFVAQALEQKSQGRVLDQILQSVQSIGTLQASLDKLRRKTTQDIKNEMSKLRSDIVECGSDIMGGMKDLGGKLCKEMKSVGENVSDSLASFPEDLTTEHDEWEDESDPLTQVFFPQGNGCWDFADTLQIVQAGRGGGGGGGWCNVM